MTPDREKELKDIPPRLPDQSRWPPGIRSIGLDEVDALGMDANGELYWHGKLVELKKPLKLTRWQSVAAIAVALSTVSMAIVDLWRAYHGQ